MALGNLLAKQRGPRPRWVKHNFGALLTDFDKNEHGGVTAARAMTSTRLKAVDFAPRLWRRAASTGAS